MGIVNFKFRFGYFPKTQEQIDPIVEYFITIVESSLVLRQPVKLVFILFAAGRANVGGYPPLYRFGGISKNTQDK